MRVPGRWLRSFVAVTLFAGVAVACGDGEGGSTLAPPTTFASTTSVDGATTTAGGTATTTGGVTTTEVSTLGPDSGTHVAWLGGFGCGVSALSEDAVWYRFREEYGNFESDQVFDVVVDDAGTAWVTTSLGTFEVRNGRWSRIADVSFDALAVNPSTGGLWGARFQEAAVFDGTSWETFSYTEFGEGENTALVDDVAVGPDGVVWVATSSTVAAYDGSAWVWWGIDQGFPDMPYGVFIESIAVGPDGRVWVSHSTGVLMFDGGSWTNLDPGVSQPKRITAADDGRVFLASWSDGFATFEDGGWTVTVATPGGLANDRVRAVEVDSRGRVWVGTSWGFSVLDQGTWVSYTMATSGVAGNCIEAIAIHGGGPPELPDPLDVKTGTLTGLIMAGDAPLADTQVVLCDDQPGMIFMGATPCTGHPVEIVTVTDAEGRFTFADIPIGDYELAWEIEEGSWRAFLGGVEPAVRAGVVTELEAIQSED